MNPSRTQQIIGWSISVLVCLFLIAVSAPGKFIDFPGKAEMFEKMDMTYDFAQQIGVLEIILALMLVIPRVGFLGAILLTGYLGGAVLTHLRINDPVYFPIIVGVLAWVGLALRQPEIFALAMGQRCVPESATIPQK